MSNEDIFNYYGFRDGQDILAIIPDNEKDADFLAGKSAESVEVLKAQILRLAVQGKSPRGAIFGVAGAGKTHCLQHLKYYFLEVNDPNLKNARGERKFEPIYVRLTAWEEKKQIYKQFFHNIISSLPSNLLIEIAREFDNVSRGQGIDMRNNLIKICKECKTNILQSMGVALDRLRMQDVPDAVEKGKAWFLGSLTKADLNSLPGASLIEKADECTDILRSLNTLLKITLDRKFVFLFDEGQQFKFDTLKLSEEINTIESNIKLLLDDQYIGMIWSFLAPLEGGALGALENTVFYNEPIKRRLGIESERQKGFVDLALIMSEQNVIKEFICGGESESEEGVLQHWIDRNKAKKIIQERKIQGASLRFFPYSEEFIDALVDKLVESGTAKPSRIIDIIGDTLTEAFLQKRYNLPISPEMLDDLNIL